MSFIRPISSGWWKSALLHEALFRSHFQGICISHSPRRPCIYSKQNLFSSASTSPYDSHREYLLSLPPPENIQKVMIANRGEIACRIIRTCKRLGICTVAIYSSIDGPNCLHAQMADEAFLIGTGPSASQSYLLMENVIQIAQDTQANAIHPGFGFLSENATFAEQVRQQGNLIFVGPPVSAMEAMASKSRSKYIMEQAGVPVTPGFDPYNSPDTTVDESNIEEQLYERAINHVGFPLIIKALMGGGGKGMRLVHSAHEFREALRSCQHEALASFGDARVLLERYLIRPRHIEVQVIADSLGNTVYLYERDCSLQRRHQKVIEEAPASDLSPSFRHLLGTMGTRAAAAVGYVNAGTVEFLLDTSPLPSSFSNSDEHPHPNIYFCEMNTRLQVEHPVTEQITGIDLVDWQLRVAAGEALPIPHQVEIPPINGHSMEARIYAENPSRNFLPSPGHVWYHRPPSVPNVDTDPLTGIRVDTGIQSGQDVSVFYDPMIAKLVCHGSTRQQAIQRLTNALKKYHIAGVSTNIDFLIRCVKHPTFQIAGAINTGFLEDHANSIFEEEQYTAPTHWATLAGAMAVLLKIERRILPSDLSSTKSTNLHPWSSHWGSWRMGGEACRPQRTLNLTLPYPMEITCTSNRDGSFDMSWVDSIKGSSDDDIKTYGPFTVSGTLTTNGDMEVVINGTNRIKLTTVMKEDNGLIHVRLWPELSTALYSDYVWEVDVVDPMSAIFDRSSIEYAASNKNGEVKAPMPGKVSRINFLVGDQVGVGDVVVVLEAMKMEHNCSSPCKGIISEIRYKPNSVVPDGAVLFAVTADD